MNQIKVGALLSYITMCINIVTGIIYTPWVINSIGKENFGLYTLAMSVISLFVFDFGLSAAATRFISKYLAEEKFEKANQCMGLVYRLYLSLDIFFFILLTVVYFFIPLLYRELTPEELSKFRVIYLMVSVYSILSFPFIPANGILQAHEKFIFIKLVGLFHKIFIVIFMSSTLLLGGGLYSLVLINVLAGMLEIIVKIIYIHQNTTQRIDYKYFDIIEFKKIIGYSGWITVISLAQRCIFTIAPTILGALSGSAAIAIMGIAITIEGYTYTFSSALNGMFLPRVSRIIANGNSDFLPLMIRIGRIQIMIISTVVIGFICFGFEFVNLWVGPQFRDSYVCSVLIILPSLFHLPQEIGIQAIAAKNMVKYEAYVFIIMALLNIAGALILGRYYGAFGICVSICIAYIIRTLGIDFILTKYLNINICFFFKETFLRFLPLLMFLLLVGLFLNSLITIQGWLGFILKGTCFIIINLLGLYVWVMNDYEKQLLLSPVMKFIKR